MGSLPRGIPVEIEVIVEIAEGPVASGRAAAAEPTSRKAAPRSKPAPRPKAAAKKKKR
jgi:hypothetical protein